MRNHAQPRIHFSTWLDRLSARRLTSRPAAPRILLRASIAPGADYYWMRSPRPKEVIPSDSPWKLGSTECRSDATTAVCNTGGVDTSTRP